MLEVHFLGGDAGDCTIVRFRGRLTVIDVNGDAASGRPTALDHLDACFPGETVHRYIQAHLRLDHMRGLNDLLARRRVRFAWLPVKDDGFPFRPTGDDLADWTSFDRLRRGRATGTQTIFPVAERGRDLLDRYDLEGWSIIMPYREMAELCQAAQGHLPQPSYILCLTYAGVRVMLSGEAGQWLWRDAVRRRGHELACTILRASHRQRTLQDGEETQPYLPALTAMRPAQVVMAADLASRDEAERIYRSCGADLIALNPSAAVVLRIDDDGTTRFTAQRPG